jgi:hypothetical protein
MASGYATVRRQSLTAVILCRNSSLWVPPRDRVPHHASRFCRPRVGSFGCAGVPESYLTSAAATGITSQSGNVSK